METEVTDGQEQMETKTDETEQFEEGAPAPEQTESTPECQSVGLFGGSYQKLGLKGGRCLAL